MLSQAQLTRNTMKSNTKLIIQATKFEVICYIARNNQNNYYEDKWDVICKALKTLSEDLPGGPVVKDSTLPLQGARVQSLVGELRSRTLRGMRGQTNKKPKINPNPPQKPNIWYTVINRY